MPCVITAPSSALTAVLMSDTHDLCVANRTLGKNVSNCLFESCSHQRKIEVFLFFPIPYHRVYAECSYFWPRIGHLAFRQPNNCDAKLASQKSKRDNHHLALKTSLHVLRSLGHCYPNSICAFRGLLHVELLDFTIHAAPRAFINEPSRGVAELSRANRAIWSFRRKTTPGCF